MGWPLQRSPFGWRPSWSGRRAYRLITKKRPLSGVHLLRERSKLSRHRSGTEDFRHSGTLRLRDVAPKMGGYMRVVDEELQML